MKTSKTSLIFIYLFIYCRLTFLSCSFPWYKAVNDPSVVGCEQHAYTLHILLLYSMH